MIYTPSLEEEVDSTASAVEDGGVHNISRIKIYRTAIIQKLFFYRVAGETYAELFENLLVYLA